MTAVNATTTVTVARMLRDGSSPRQVADALDITEDQVRQLASEIPGLPTGRPTRPAPAVITDLPTRMLAAHPANIRDDLGDLSELAQTISEHGVLQALLVTRTADGYVVLDGHRRLGAAIMAGVTRVPVTLRGQTSDAEATIVMLVTGMQKLALDPIDEAMAYQRLERAGYKQGEIAALIGKNQGHVSQRLALLNLTPAEQTAVRRREITVQDAYRAGRDRSPRRMDGPQARPKPKRVPHFTREHPLATTVATRCGHETTLKLGPACGPCWEAAIRDDAVIEHVLTSTRAINADTSTEGAA